MPDDLHLFARTERTPHLTWAQRVANGRSARKRLPRSAIAGWTAPANRRDPVALVLGQEATRVPDLLPIRHERMGASPFAFYRGAAVVMANDLARRPDSGLRVQLCGDAHIANFGGYLTADRGTVFDLNDFDETHRGPFEWDILRLATSVVLAARSIGCSPKQVRAMAAGCAASYRTAMAGFADLSTLDVWYSRLDLREVLARAVGRMDEDRIARFRTRVEKATGKDSQRAFTRLTEVVDGQVRFRADPPLIAPLETLAADDVDPERAVDWIRHNLRSYRRTLQDDRRHLLDQYRLVDAARKVVGVGSVGTRCWIVLMLARDNSDPLVLQIKEAQASVLEPFTGPSTLGHHGRRVVTGQRILQASSDIMLGWMHTTALDGSERDFYVRQLWDGKFSVDLANSLPDPLALNGELCGWILARGHARSGDRAAIAAYLGSSDTFDRSVADFAEDYADQSEADHAAFVRAVGTP